jgi:hypothetical protein
MRPLLDWLRSLGRPDRSVPARRSDAPRAFRRRAKRSSILECVTCGRRKLKAGAWTPGTSPLDEQPIYTVCADCAAKRGPA